MSNPKFTFEIDKQTVLLSIDHFGKESLYVNNEMIESGRRFRISGDYNFAINDTGYTLRYRIKNIFTGNIECNLYKGNDLVVSKYTLAKLGDKNKILSLTLLLFLCGLVGYLAPRMGDWIWFSPILFMAAVVVSMSCRERIYDIESK